MLPRQPRTVVIAFAIWWMVSFFAAPQRFETEVFVPRIRMKLSDSKSSVAETRHRSAQVGPTTRFHLHRLIRHSICLRIGEHSGRRRLASGADCVARGNANWAGRVCVRKTDSPSHQPIHVRRVDMRVAERSDRIEPLLVRRDEQNLRPGHTVIMSKAKNLGSILDRCPNRNDQRCLKAWPHAWHFVGPLKMTAVSIK